MNYCPYINIMSANFLRVNQFRMSNTEKSQLLQKSYKNNEIFSDAIATSTQTAQGCCSFMRIQVDLRTDDR